MLEGTREDRGPLFAQGRSAWSRFMEIEPMVRLLGLPADYVESLKNDDARKLLGRLSGELGSGLQEKLASAEADSLDLLGRMLRLKPEERVSASTALEHSFFSEVRNPIIEARTPTRITATIDDLSQSLTEDLLREHFGKELQKYGSQPRV